MASPDYADIRASLEFINILENLIKQGGAPAPSQDSPEYGNKGTGWDYASSTPPPEGAQTLLPPAALLGGEHLPHKLLLLLKLMLRHDNLLPA